MITYLVKVVVIFITLFAFGSKCVLRQCQKVQVNLSSSEALVISAVPVIWVGTFVACRPKCAKPCANRN